MRRPISLPGRLRRHFTSAHLIASLALFVALGGSAVAVSQVPRGSVGSAQIKRGAVKAPQIGRAAVKARHIGGAAVTRGKIAPRAVNNTRIAAGAVNSPKIANGSVIRNKIAPSAVDASRLAPGAVSPAALASGAVGSEALADGSVHTADLANNSVTRAKLAEASLPMLAPLRSGQTLRGMVALTANADGGSASVAATDAQSFQFPMIHAPTLHVIDATAGTPAATAECPGIAGGNQQTPQAAPGHLCVYLRHSEGQAPGGAEPPLLAATDPNASVTRLGFSLTATFSADGGTVVAQWAATAG